MSEKLGLDSDRGASRPFLLQPSSAQVWVQALGRLLYQGGYGAIQFFIPLVFVNQVHLSATAVGFAVGCGSLAGVVGHLLGGYLADSPAYGRKRALLFAAILSLVAALMLVKTETLSLLLFVNLVMGVSAGCYWTAADATVVDVTPGEQRQRAFAILVLADNLGLGLGIWGGGRLLEAHQTLFFVGAIVLILFLVLVQFGVTETQSASEKKETMQGFVVALKDSALRLFFVINVLFATYIALVSSTLPLYFTNLVGAGTTQTDVSSQFTWWYVGLGALLQLPLVQVLGSLRQVSVLTISMLLWGLGFLLVWMSGLVAAAPVGMILSLGVFSIAGAAYKPFAPAIVAELAPVSLRGIYLAISYQCWSIGYFIGPLLGGWALDQSAVVSHNAWLIAAATTLGGILLLFLLSRRTLVTKSVEDALVLEQSKAS